MTKKTFATAPKPRQPTADEIDAYENGGVGHDQPAARAATEGRPVTNERSKRLSLDLPASMHPRFKTACSATGRKMVNELQELIERRTAELEEEAGITRK